MNTAKYAADRVSQLSKYRTTTARQIGFEMNVIALKQDSSLTELDWKVVQMARGDGPRSLNPEWRLTRFLRDFLGIPMARRLASEKLEALRRFSVRAWYWDVIRTKDLRIVIDAGYSSIDVFQILAHVGGYRGFAPSIEGQPM